MYLLLLFLIILIVTVILFKSGGSPYNESYLSNLINTRIDTLRNIYNTSDVAVLRSKFTLNYGIINDLKQLYEIQTIDSGVLFVNSYSTNNDKMLKLEINNLDFFELNNVIRPGTICCTACYDIPHTNPHNDFNYAVSLAENFLSVTPKSIAKIVLMKNNRPLTFLKLKLKEFGERVEFYTFLTDKILGTGNRVEMINPLLTPSDIFHERIIWNMFEEYVFNDNDKIDGIMQLDTPFSTGLNRHLFSVEYQIFHPETVLNIACVLYVKPNYDIEVFTDKNLWRSFINNKIIQYRNSYAENITHYIEKPIVEKLTEDKINKVVSEIDNICKKRFDIKNNNW